MGKNVNLNESDVKLAIQMVNSLKSQCPLMYNQKLMETEEEKLNDTVKDQHGFMLEDVINSAENEDLVIDINEIKQTE